MVTGNDLCLKATTQKVGQPLKWNSSPPHTFRFNGMRYNKVTSWLNAMCWILIPQLFTHLPFRLWHNKIVITAELRDVLCRPCSAWRMPNETVADDAVDKNVAVFSLLTNNIKKQHTVLPISSTLKTSLQWRTSLWATASYLYTSVQNSSGDWSNQLTWYIQSLISSQAWERIWFY